MAKKLTTDELMKKLRDDDRIDRPHTYMIPESLLDSPLVKDVLESGADVILIKDKREWLRNSPPKN
jgi:hypothetical protein